MKRLLPRIITASTLCLMLILIMATSAMAQIFQDHDPSQPPPIRFSIKNKQLQDVLHLQNQNQILKQLILHEQAVNNIVTSSLSLGIQKPNIPAPDSQSCRAIPANIPCAQAYKDMYDGFSVERVTAATAAQTGPVLPPAASLLDNSDIPSLDAGSLPDIPAELFSNADLYWTDITCLGSQCSAVITPDPGNRKARYRVIPGEKLPDGSIIQSISASGVRLERNKKIISLDPAPNS